MHACTNGAAYKRADIDNSQLMEILSTTLLIIISLYSLYRALPVLYINHR
jgi:ABC-type nickel/cobalt efflux system permease component RcnA